MSISLGAGHACGNSHRGNSGFIITKGEGGILTVFKDIKLISYITKVPSKVPSKVIFLTILYELQISSD